jgi:hypothetical protein
VTWNPVGALGKSKRNLDVFEDKPCRGGNPFLAMALSQLGEFSTSLQHQKQGEAAQRVLSWIRVIVDAIEASDTASPGAHTQEELVNMQNGLVLTKRIKINSADRRKIPEQVIQATRKSSLIVLEQWKIALDTTSWEALDEHGRDVTESFSALRLTPLDLASASPIAAFFGERTDYLQSSVIHATILAYRCIGECSDAFRCVFSDDVVGLMMLLAEQRATIRDLDEGGRSLLHVSCAPHTEAIWAWLTTPAYMLLE